MLELQNLVQLSETAKKVVESQQFDDDFYDSITESFGRDKKQSDDIELIIKTLQKTLAIAESANTKADEAQIKSESAQKITEQLNRKVVWWTTFMGIIAIFAGILTMVSTAIVIYSTFFSK